jgi:Transglutaminase-like superfamily
MARLRNLWLALTVLPALLFNGRQRRLFAEMRAFCRRLPSTLAAPMPQVLAALTPAAADLPLPAPQVRRLADVAILLDRRSPLGVCLRRSLTRYYYLRRAGLPVAVQFGARFVSGKPDREIAGHAWLTLDGQPYFEEQQNYRGFTVMYSYPSA